MRFFFSHNSSSHYPCTPERNRRNACYLSTHLCIPWFVGLTGHQTAVLPHSWAVPTLLPHSLLLLMSVVATLCQSSPMVNLLEVPLAQNCSQPPSPLWLGTVCDTWPMKTHVAPHQSWGWMNRWGMSPLNGGRVCEEAAYTEGRAFLSLVLKCPGNVLGTHLRGGVLNFSQ